VLGNAVDRATLYSQPVCYSLADDSSEKTVLLQTLSDTRAQQHHRQSSSSTSQLKPVQMPGHKAIFAGATLGRRPTGTVFTIWSGCANKLLKQRCVLRYRSTRPGYRCPATPSRCSRPALCLPTRRPYYAGAQTIRDGRGGSPAEPAIRQTTRLDWNWTNKTQIYGRYAIESLKFFVGSNANSPWAGFNTGTSNSTRMRS